MSTGAKAKYLLLFGIINFALYFTIETLIVTSEYDFLWSLDLAIPLIPEFIWIYHSFIAVIIISFVGLMKSKKMFFSCLAGFFLATFILSAFYILFPSYYPRELWPATADTLSGQLLNWTRAIDAPNNTLPSGHNAFAWMLTFFMTKTAYAKQYKWLVPSYFVWASLITASTLFLKQHYIIDTISGIILAYICYHFSIKVIMPRIKENNTTHKQENDHPTNEAFFECQEYIRS